MGVDLYVVEVFREWIMFDDIDSVCEWVMRW